MGGWITVGISAIVAYSFFKIDQTALMTISIINAVISFWSFGVMYNYGSYALRLKADVIKENLKVEGRLDKEAEAKLEALNRTTCPNAVPNWITLINMASFIVALGLLTAFFFLR